MIHLSQTSTKGFNDVVFDHRNQAYGAYVLRREYPVNVLKSLFIGIAIIASILAIPYLAKLLYHEAVERKIPTTTSHPTVVDIHKNILKPAAEKQREKEVKPPPPPPPGNTNGVGAIVLVDTVMEEVINVKNDDSLTFGVANGKGDPFTRTTIGQGPKGGTGTGKNDSIHNPFGLDRNPSYPGGDEAMKRFLGENLVYPDYAKSMGIEGKVHVTFVVNETGKVVNIKVPREIGGGLDAEAIRVVGMMPKWDPGVFEGVPVKVAYHLPIVFKLNF